MNTEEILNLVSKDDLLSRSFLGVYPRDGLPRRLPFLPCCLIANTDTSSEPGAHWVAFYFRSDGIGEYFDSYGRDIQHREFYNFLQRHCIDYIVNAKRLQQLYSTICGEYCIYFLLHRSFGISMSSILSRFIVNFSKNDRIVQQFMHSYFKRQTVVQNFEFLCHQIARQLENL